MMRYQDWHLSSNEVDRVDEQQMANLSSAKFCLDVAI